LVEKKAADLYTVICRTCYASFYLRSLTTLAGGVLVLAGIVMLIMPGPGWITIAAGVAVWGREYHWARRLLGWVKQRVRTLRDEAIKR
jgi:uncharacterized protein (TIGR02611 family)